jgi:hypothetical protein
MLIIFLIIAKNVYFYQMKVAEYNPFKIYVYADDHPPPHCHVRYNDGSEMSIDLPLLKPRYGETISKEVEKILKLNLDELCEAWEKLNQ